METVDDYLTSLDPQNRLRVDELRGLVKTTVPKAVERFSYGVIMYKTEYDLVGIGTAKNVISLYAMGIASDEKFINRLGNYKIKGKTLHLPLNEPWDHELLSELILERATQNTARAQNRKKSKA